MRYHSSVVSLQLLYPRLGVLLGIALKKHGTMLDVLQVPPGSVDFVEFLVKPADQIVLYRSVSRDTLFLYPLQQPVSDQGKIKERLEGECGSEDCGLVQRFNTVVLWPLDLPVEQRHMSISNVVREALCSRHSTDHAVDETAKNIFEKTTGYYSSIVR